MPRGSLSKVDMLAFIYRKKRDISHTCHQKKYTLEQCKAADDTLNDVLDYLNTFSN